MAAHGSKKSYFRRPCRQLTHCNHKICRCCLYRLCRHAVRRYPLPRRYRQSGPPASGHEARRKTCRQKAPLWLWLGDLLLGVRRCIMIFAVGAGISLYEGIQKIIHPHPIESAVIAYVVLGLAIIFEGWAWTVAFKEFRRTQGTRPFLTAVRDSKDPTFSRFFLKTQLQCSACLLPLQASTALKPSVLHGSTALPPL